MWKNKTTGIKSWPVEDRMYNLPSAAEKCLVNMIMLFGNVIDRLHNIC